ncbi:UvrB/UvrC motif-containing protein [Sedimentisphaera cyanobacteriorum]|nr:UvrB/UvrC motif-containing protein [Sedimentisphaera cyanobacteriorum]
MAEYINGKQREVHFCEKCVQETLSEALNGGSLSEMMGKLIGSVSPEAGGEEKTKSPAEQKNYECPVCGETYSGFTRDTLLGCPEDYFVFSNKISDVLSNTEIENPVHSGKLPSKSLEDTVNENIRQTLNIRIEKALENEDYESAAQIRDRLRSL